MNDIISRQAAIYAIVNTVSKIGLHDNSEAARYGATFRHLEILDIIEGMPSAHPERKTGRWIVMETAYEDTVAKCPECGFETLVNEPGNGLHMLDDLKFCPSCGVKLEGGDAECQQT